MQTAFLEQIVAYEASIVLVVTPQDRVDPEAPPTLDNFAIPKHHLVHIERVVLVDEGTRDILHSRD